MINYLLFYELLFRALCSQEAAERSGLRCERHSADNRQILSHQKADEVSHILGFFVFKFYQTCADGIDSILEDHSPVRTSLFISLFVCRRYKSINFLGI
jgi:hypothetical protein